VISNYAELCNGILVACLLCCGDGNRNGDAFPSVLYFNCICCVLYFEHFCLYVVYFCV